MLLHQGYKVALFRVQCNATLFLLPLLKNVNMDIPFFHRRKKYRHIFFDLDRTIWDFERNKDIALEELYTENRLETAFPTLHDFIACYTRHNDYLWGKYQRNELTKDVLRFKRFDSTLREANIDNEPLAIKMGDDYLRILPLKNTLIEGTAELLEYLAPKYSLHIITNGFSEVQSPKLERAGIRGYFQWVITSEQAGYHKPDPRAFGYALSKANAKKAESMMVGDDFEVDIIGAKKFGIDQIYLNPAQLPQVVQPTHNVAKLLEIISKKIL